MELMIDFRFRLLEREDFIALSRGEAVAMLSPTVATVNRFCVKAHLISTLL